MASGEMSFTAVQWSCPASDPKSSPSAVTGGALPIFRIPRHCLVQHMGGWIFGVNSQRRFVTGPTESLSTNFALVKL
jgi:hypothetical protein